MGLGFEPVQREPYEPVQDEFAKCEYGRVLSDGWVKTRMKPDQRGVYTEGYQHPAPWASQTGLGLGIGWPAFPTYPGCRGAGDTQQQIHRCCLPQCHPTLIAQGPAQSQHQRQVLTAPVCQTHT
jgi:hypothetical protein